MLWRWRSYFTNNEEIAEKCKSIRFHGTTEKDRYHSETIGLNGRLDSIQAVLLEKLTIFDDELKMRNIINSHYREFLNNAQYHPKEYQSAHALFSIVLGSSEKRNNLIQRLQKIKFHQQYIINFRFI